jgi:hypothetical protein
LYQMQELRSIVGFVEDQPAEDGRRDRMKLEHEAGRDAEVSAAAPHGPEEVDIVGLARRQNFAVGRHDIGLEQVVGAEAEAAHQVANAAAEGQARDARVRHVSTCDGKTKRICDAVDLSPQGTATHSHEPRRLVDLDGVDPAHVDDQRVVGHRKSGEAVPAGPDGDLQPLFDAEGERHSLLGPEAKATEAAGHLFSSMSLVLSAGCQVSTRMTHS